MGKTVISLSTTPDRIILIGPTIASLLDQTFKVDEICINIPKISRKGKKYKIPKWLKNIKYVEIYRVEKDEGPATKLLPTLRRESKNTRIIVVDDDIIYNSKTVETLLESYQFYKKKAAITNFGIALDKKGKLPQNTERVLSFFRSSREVDLLQGFSGFLVTPKMFPKQVYDLNKGPPEAISVDDVWFSGWLRVNAIKIMTPGTTFLQLPLINFGEMRNTISLGGTENKEFKTDKVVIKWFMKTHKLKPIYSSSQRS